MNYNNFIIKKMKEEDSHWVLTIPIIGWFIAIICFGFFFPIWYLCTKCFKEVKDCSECVNFKRRKVRTRKE